MTCPTVGALSISNDAKTFAQASDVAFIAGGVFIVTGIVCLLAAPRSPAAKVARVMLLGGTF